MIPDLPNLSTAQIYGEFISPYSEDKSPFVDYARGGVELYDASQGLDVKDWKLEFDGDDWVITSEGSPKTVVSVIPKDARWVSLAFDQNMNPTVAYVFGDNFYLWWYNPVAGKQVITEYANASYPILRMDDVRQGAIGVNDVILSYLKDTTLYVRVQRDRYNVEYELARNAGNKLLQAGMSRAMRFQWKTTFAYPETLPCPQADMDLKPRERRYLSDIGDVRNMRMFQQEFQATRNKINFIFTEEEAAEFRDWYENVLIHGGAWFYADWPLLHKDKEIAHRFVGQPKWEWIYGGNPGKLGRSKQGGGFVLPDDAVTVYKVSATIEVYDRKVENFYNTALYPLHYGEHITASHITIQAAHMPPKLYVSDDITASQIVVSEATMSGYVYSDYLYEDHITASQITIPEATMIQWIYTDKAFEDNISASPITIIDGEITARLITYSYFEDDVTASHITIAAGEIK